MGCTSTRDRPPDREASVSAGSETGPKERLFGEFARIGKAVASPRRLVLLDLLSQGEKTVETLARQSGMGVKNTSAHLATLREARLVEGRRDGQHVRYRLADDSVFDFLRRLQALGRSRLAEVERVVDDFYRDPDGVEPVGADELLRRMAAGEVTVLDVRPRDEYEAGHIPGALSVPVDELERRLERLPADREVVAYCRGPYCIYSVQAVRALRGSGRKARLLAVGFPDWRAGGRPTESPGAAGAGTSRDVCEIDSRKRPAGGGCP